LLTESGRHHSGFLGTEQNWQPQGEEAMRTGGENSIGNPEVRAKIQRWQEGQ